MPQVSWFETEDRFKLPEMPGVYIWLNVDGKVLYVGSTKNLLNRHASKAGGHHGIITQPRRIRYGLFCEDDVHLIKSIEVLLINALKPTYNACLFDGNFNKVAA
jgi:excinuclease UvrABC nuclease subunit